MNTTREELIEFLQWYKDYYPELRPIEEAVDYYLEAIAEKRKGTKGYHDVEEFYP